MIHKMIRTRTKIQNGTQFYLMVLSQKNNQKTKNSNELLIKSKFIEFKTKILKLTFKF